MDKESVDSKTKEENERGKLKEGRKQKTRNKEEKRKRRRISEGWVGGRGGVRGEEGVDDAISSCEVVDPRRHGRLDHQRPSYTPVSTSSSSSYSSLSSSYFFSILLHYP